MVINVITNGTAASVRLSNGDEIKRAVQLLRLYTHLRRMQGKSSDMSYGGSKGFLFGSCLCHLARATERFWENKFDFIGN